MELTLVRHGIAIDREDPESPPEAERYLTKEGLLRTRQAMSGLAASDLTLDEIWTSPFLRAAQTAQIAAEELGIDPKRIRTTEALLPGADPARIFRELAKAGAESVGCFGHAPHLDEAIALAIGARSSFTSLKKAGAAQLTVDPGRPGRGVLVWLATARQLRELRK